MRMEQQMNLYLMYSDWCLLLTFALPGAIAILLLLGRRIIWANGNGEHVDESGAKHKLPPGSTGFPLVGETIGFLRAANSSRRRKFVDEHELRYGPIFRCNLFGSSKSVVSLDPEFNKYIIQNEGRLVQTKAPAPARNLIGRYGLLEVHGDLQKKIHAIAVNWFKYERLSSDFMEDIQNIFLDGMNKWQEQREILLQHKCQEIVLSLMGKKLLDLAPSEMEGICKAFHDFNGAVLSLPINIPGTSYSRGIKARRFLINTIYDCINERRKHPEAIHNDILNKLLEGNIFSNEIIADTLLFLLFAGFETSSSAMAFSIKFITENPRALEELKAEHDDIIKLKGNTSGKLTWDDYQSMKFTHFVINETLRLASAASCLFRETMQDIKTKGFVIPKGWNIYALVSAINLDDKYYYEADKFNPWRWQNEKLLDAPCYMPFGGGSRLCPGLHLGRFEISLFLHYFITKFRWEPLEIDHVTYFPLPCMEKGFPLYLYPRLKNEEK